MANTQSKEVNLTKRVVTAKGMRYCQVVLSANGRVKPDLVVVNGKPERHPEGAYYVEWREKGRRIRLSVGKDAQDAAARRQRKEAELQALNNGVSVLPENGDGHRSILTAVSQFLEETELTKKPKTLAAYTTALNYFTESCPKLYLQDIDRHDLLKFSAFLRDEKNQSPRSCWNKFSNVMTFLKANGVLGLAKKGDWPRYTEEEPEMYEQAELDTLFKTCNEEERLWFEFFLMTGMREQEVMHLYWSDVNFTAATVRVSHKPDRDWTPKAYKEREIPIPAKLVKKLKAWKAKADKTCGLVFPTSGCNPKLDFLDCLKACAERAKLDKEDFWLHKFRSTFATRCLWAGVDLRTVQQWLGHSHMESKCLTNTPVRRGLSVFKWLDERRTEDFGIQAAHTSGNSAASGGVCEQRHATQRVLPQSGFELRHADSAPEEATLEEKEPSSFFGRSVGAGGVGRQEIADAAGTELWAGRGAAGRAPHRGTS